MFQRGFFSDLEVIGNPNRVFKVLKGMGYRVRILSACVESEFCKLEKLHWIRRNLPTIEMEEIILCKVGENKSDYVEDIATSVLVDDYGKNLQDWHIKGGIPIKFISSISNKEKDRKCKYVHDLVELPLVLKEIEMGL
jgi:5'(3')-deoxyribonucleotidase